MEVLIEGKKTNIHPDDVIFAKVKPGQYISLGGRPQGGEVKLSGERFCAYQRKLTFVKFLKRVEDLNTKTVEAPTRAGVRGARHRMVTEDMGQSRAEGEVKSFDPEVI